MIDWVFILFICIFPVIKSSFEKLCYASIIFLKQRSHLKTCMHPVFSENTSNFKEVIHHY